MNWEWQPWWEMLLIYPLLFARFSGFSEKFDFILSCLHAFIAHYKLGLCVEFAIVKIIAISLDRIREPRG